MTDDDFMDGIMKTAAVMLFCAAGLLLVVAAILTVVLARLAFQ